jgi:hypothetical protein
VDIIPGRYAVCFLRQPDAQNYSAIAASGISYCIDDELVSCCELHSAAGPVSLVFLWLSVWGLVPHTTLSLLLQLYEPFYADFGPLNLGKTHRFCEHTKQLLQVRVAGGRASTAAGSCAEWHLLIVSLCSCRKLKRGARSCTCTQVLSHKQGQMRLCW